MAALKLLICDPDSEWLGKANTFFSEKGYEVFISNNGKDAQLKIYNNELFAIIMNSELRNHTAVQVLKFVKSKATGVRILFIQEEFEEGSDEEGIPEEELRKLGVTEHIKKPFELEDLVVTLEGHQSLGDLIGNLPKKKGVSDEEESSQSDEEFTKVKIDEFYSSQAVLFDIYVRLGSGRYVKILHAGDNFSKDRIDKYKNDKGMKFLHFHNRDRRKYIQFTNFLAGQFIANEKVDTGTKVKIVKNLTEKYIEEAFTVGLKPLVIAQGKEVCENVYKVIQNDKDLHKILKSFEEFDPSAYTHAFLVTMFAGCIIKQHEWQSKTTIETVAMACMFHDIGKMKVSKEILDKNPKEWSDEERAEYEKHPEYGMEMVDGINSLSNSIKQIIYQHHEAYNGSGFPLGIKASRILTLANIVGMADALVHVIESEKITPVEALKTLLKQEEQVMKFNSQIVQNLIKVFMDPEKILKENNLPTNSSVVSKKAS